MQALILSLHVLVAVSIVVLVLIQHGKGADVGAAFGSGSSNTMFGSTGVTPFLVKLTATLAAVFFATSLVLNYFDVKMVKPRTNVLGLNQPAISKTIPAEPTKDRK